MLCALNGKKVLHFAQLNNVPIWPCAVNALIWLLIRAHFHHGRRATGSLVEAAKRQKNEEQETEEEQENKEEGEENEEEKENEEEQKTEEDIKNEVGHNASVTNLRHLQNSMKGE